MPSKDDLIDFFGLKLNRYLYDNFISTDQLTEAPTGSAVITSKLFEMLLQTGILQGSTARINYNMNYFNPHFSTALFRLYFQSITSVFAYIGFKESLSDPTFDMTESHIGLLIYEGKLYLSSGNQLGVEEGYSNIPISGIDLTTDFIFKLKYNQLFTAPLPQRIPYFGGYTLVKFDRKWTLKATAVKSPPEDMLHYFVVFIKNMTNDNKSLYFRNFMYAEDYPD